MHDPQRVVLKSDTSIAWPEFGIKAIYNFSFVLLRLIMWRHSYGRLWRNCKTFKKLFCSPYLVLTTLLQLMAWCNIPLRPKSPEQMLTQIHVAIWRYWQDELIAVILKLHSHSLLTHWDRDKMAAILQTTCAIIQSYFFHWTDKSRRDRLFFPHWTETKRLPLGRRHIQIHFNLWLLFYFHQNSFRICHQGSI